MTRVLIDADGCPVADEVVCLYGHFGAGYLILCDMSHHFEKVGTRTLVVSRGADSINFALVNLLRPGDIVVTQDYGLVAMCMTRGARVLDQDGMEYTAQNIGALLPTRRTTKEVRNAGSRLKGPRERLSEQDQAFYGRSVHLLGEE